MLIWIGQELFDARIPALQDEGADARRERVNLARDAHHLRLKMLAATGYMYRF